MSQKIHIGQVGYASEALDKSTKVCYNVHHTLQKRIIIMSYVIEVWKFDYRYKIGRRYVESYCIDNLDDKNKQEFVAKLREKYPQEHYMLNGKEELV